MKHVAITLALFAALSLPVAAQPAGGVDLRGVADRVFAEVNAPDRPGCAVGVAQRGVVLLTRGYGAANLEAGTPITASTILESGSVAKQFTAAAVLLLASEGKLRLDDEVQQYVPELPRYGRPLRIRHLLSHTSGLREWSNLVGLAGWPRGSRVHRQADLLEYVVAQRSLNYPVGDFYSYTNSGFALLPTIIERVSGTSFVQFSNDRIFTPLGLTHTRWRDDFTQVVPARAQAYSRSGTGWRLNMPFENVLGPGGLLTTVGDWLAWNDHLDRKTLGAAVVDSLERQAVLTTGRRIEYAMGLRVQQYRGQREVAHSGSTGGYSTYLTRFPEHGVSVAVLCNYAGAPATRFARQMAEALMPNLAPPAPLDTVATDRAVVARLAGVYRSTRTHEPLVVGSSAQAGAAPAGEDDDTPAVRRGLVLRALADGSWLLGTTRVRFEVNDDGTPRGLRALLADGDTVQYVFAGSRPWAPAAAQLAEFEGTYRSDEVGATYVATVQNGRLVLSPRAAVRRTLTPVYADAFAADGGMGTVWFTRDAQGRIEAMHSGAARVWDIRFERVR